MCDRMGKEQAVWLTNGREGHALAGVAKGHVEREGYSAHVKSSGREIRRPVGMTPGCLRRAVSSSCLASYPTNNSPSATTAYWPAYVSTSSSKCRRIHSSSFTWTVDFGLRDARFAIVEPLSRHLYKTPPRLSRTADRPASSEVTRLNGHLGLGTRCTLRFPLLQSAPQREIVACSPKKGDM